MIIQWEWEAPRDADMERDMALAADAALRAEGAINDCAVHVLITDDESIRSVNRTLRGIDRATDVLSFPTVRYPKGRTAGHCADIIRREYDDDADGCMLGDVIISLPRAKEQADSYGHGVRREMCYLLVHGLFHLFGYDHMEAEDKAIMRDMEEKALSTAGITRGEGLLSDEELIKLAREAMERAYVPYSGYAVGACLLLEDGRVYTGCNIENASYGLSNCAERTAIFKAVSEGATEFRAIAVTARSSAPWPCGACRQVLNEFAPNIRVIVAWDGGRDERSLNQLLPCAFGPKSLE